jgi:ribonuclease PH
MIVSKVVQNAIIATLHPRTLIEIVIQVLHDDGSVRPSALVFLYPFSLSLALTPCLF